MNITINNEIILFNKIDLAVDPVVTKHDCEQISNIFISAKNQTSKEKVMAIIEKNLNQFKTEMIFKIPFNKMQYYALLHKKSNVLSTENTETEVILKCKINKILGAKIMADLHRD